VVLSSSSCPNVVFYNGRGMKVLHFILGMCGMAFSLKWKNMMDCDNKHFFIIVYNVRGT
jgi:hypothetical protein